MRKKLVLLLILLIFSLKMGHFSEKTGIIASFNSLHLGWKGKNYEKVAKILQKYDLIGLQEVMKPIGVQLLVENLRNITKISWRYHISDKKVGTARYKEYYAYIWRTDKVDLIKRLGFYDEIKDSDFIREPYGCIFKIGEFDFTFVLCHLIFATKNDRRSEAKRLADVYEYFQSLNKHEQDVIIAGDFNLPGNDEGFAALREHPDNIKYAIPFVNKTTIGTSGNLASSYDNFFYSSIYTKEIEYSQVNNFLKDIEMDPKKARKEVSDHLPIFFLAYTEKDDD